MKYTVQKLLFGNTTEDIEADTPDAALADASDFTTLCHQCQDKIEIGGSYGASVLDAEGNEVLAFDESDDLRSEAESLRTQVAELIKERDRLAARLMKRTPPKTQPSRRESIRGRT